MSGLMIYILLFVLTNNQAFGKNRCKCDLPTLFFEEISCKPIYENASDCCPKAFNCSKLMAVPKNHCHLLGKTFGNNEDIPYSVFAPSCYKNCKCKIGAKYKFASNIICSIENCPEETEDYELDCYNQYTLDSCCSTGTICAPFDETTSCKDDGETYYRGQEIYPNSDIEYKCICDGNWTGIIKDSSCIKRKCLTEITHSLDIDNFCAVVFLVQEKMEPCPESFICPKGTEAIKRIGISSHHKCKFGTNSLDIGDSFTITERISRVKQETSICECKIPPFVTCLKSEIYD